MFLNYVDWKEFLKLLLQIGMWWVLYLISLYIFLISQLTYFEATATQAIFSATYVNYISLLLGVPLQSSPRLVIKLVIHFQLLL